MIGNDPICHENHERKVDCTVGRYCIAFGKEHSMGGVKGHKTGPLIAL